MHAPVYTWLILCVLWLLVCWCFLRFLFALQLVLRMEEALSASSSARGSSATASDPAPAAASTPDAPANSPPGLSASAAAAAQLLPWPEHQLPLAELLSLLYWLQQHVVRLQLAPGASADLYMDPDLEVYAAVRVPMLAMQSRPTLIGGEGSRQGVFVDACVGSGVSCVEKEGAGLVAGVGPVTFVTLHASRYVHQTRTESN